MECVGAKCQVCGSRLQEMMNEERVKGVMKNDAMIAMLRVPVYTKRRPRQQGVATRHVLLQFASCLDVEADGPHVERVLAAAPGRLFVSFDCAEAAAAAAERLRGTVSCDASVPARERGIECCFCSCSSDHAQEQQEEKIAGVSLLETLDKNAPPGLLLQRDFVSIEEEQELIAFLDAQKWDDEIKRRVQHYGYSFDYKTRSVNPSFAHFTPIPDVLTRLFDRLVKAGMPGHPDQITVNEYVPGIGIKPHIDTHSAFTDGIASLSLGGDIAMELRHSGGEGFGSGTGERFGLGLARRSLLLLRGESRYAWTHGIAARKSDVIDGRLVLRTRRLSVTFRQVTSAGSGCRCRWPSCCDSQAHVPAAAAPDVEKKGVEGFYNRIADHFSQTRHTPWPKVVAFIKQIKPGDTVLDVGCGNGRHLLPVRESGAALFGCDLIPRFVEICVAERRLEVLRADAQHLPYRSHVFDTVLCVAVVHHFATHERRLRCIAELVRVTSLKGRVLVTAWALEQEQAEKSRRVFGAQDVAVPWVLPAASDPERQEEVKALPDEKARKALQPVAVERFCHVFVEGELEALVSQLPNVQIVESYYDNANWAVVLKKIAL